MSGAVCQLEMPTPLAMTEEEMAILRPPERVSMEVWAEQNYVLSAKVANKSGAWSNDYTPFLIEPMQRLSSPGTQQVTMMCCSQSGKSELTHIFLGYTIDQDPAPFMIVMPTEATVQRRVNTRLRPMFEECPSLLRHLGGSIDNLNIGKETLLDTMNLYLGWAGSAVALADVPVAKGVADELAKFPEAAGKEADPVSLFKKRMRTFGSRSILLATSTPVYKNDHIHREFKAGNQCEWWAKCVHCGEYHVMKWANVVIEKDERGYFLESELYRQEEHAWYVCPKCGVRWTEIERWQSARAGRWAPAGCTVRPDGGIEGEIKPTSHYSYHVTALMLYLEFQTIGNLAAEWAKAQFYRKTGNIKLLQDFINSELGEPFEEREKQTEISVLKTHVGEYQRSVVPAGVQMLTCGIDVQGDHVWYTVWGYGYMSQAWLIEEGRIETGDTAELANFELVEQLLASSWPIADSADERMSIRIAGIDCSYHTDVVQDFCLKSATNVVPIMGDHTVKARLYRRTPVMGGKLYRYDLAVNQIKDRLFRLLYQATVKGDGYMHLHKGVSEDTLNQLCSEEITKERLGRKTIETWKVKREGRANHEWDCTVYADFAAELAGARTLPDPANPPKRIKLSERQSRGRTLRFDR